MIKYIKKLFSPGEKRKDKDTLSASTPISLSKEYLEILDNVSLPAAMLNNKNQLLLNQTAQKYGFQSLLTPKILNQPQVTLGDKKYQIHKSILQHSSYKALLIFKEVENNEELATIGRFFEYSSMAAIVVDERCNIIQANEASKYTLEPAISEEKDQQKNIGQNFLSFFTSESGRKIKIALQECASFNPPAGPLELIGKDDKTLLAYVGMINARGENYFVFEVTDATKYKTLENTFVHSQRMQALGQLSGAVAHDFNNLLTAITGFCDLLLVRHPPGDKSFTELMQIKQNSNRAANLIRQLLAFSRRQVMQPSIINITDTIAELSNLIARLIGGNIELVIDHSRDLHHVKVDQSQFEQVIINLVVNARDAMPEGGKLTIATQNITINKDFHESDYYSPIGGDRITPGEYTLITITDTGSGIGEDILDKIFEPFFSTKDASSGTGLGLATVFGIIQQTGGYIRLKTQEKVGTSFFIFLKAVKVNLVEIRSKEPAIVVTEDSNDKLLYKEAGQKGKILIVEDETAVRMFNTYALGNKGYEILEADSGETALEILEKEGESVDLIITDVIMPGMSGQKLAQEVNIKYPHIKLIFTSGYAEDAISYLSNTDCHFLNKPYSLQELLSKVALMLVDKDEARAVHKNPPPIQN